jgi:hypothetical protein
MEISAIKIINEYPTSLGSKRSPSLSTNRIHSSNHSNRASRSVAGIQDRSSRVATPPQNVGFSGPSEVELSCILRFPSFLFTLGGIIVFQHRVL